MKVFAAVLLAVNLVVAQSSSELLQKGIYLQETVGDIDGAIKIYKQIGQTAKESRANAAQAQFRLGVCLEKKGQHAEAARIFQNVVADFPEQTALVARAKALLPSGPKLLPAPLVDGEILDLTAHMGGSAQTSAVVKMRFSVQSDKTNPANWRFENRMYNFASMFTAEVEANKETLRPVVARNYGHPMLGKARVAYQDGEVRFEIEGKDPRTIKLDGPVFDLNELAELLRRLPLAIGYQTVLPTFAAEAGDSSQVRIAVATEDDVKTPAGDFRAYRVEVNQTQTYWISTDASRYLVKLEQGPMMTAVLTSIGRSDRPGVYRNEKLGIQMNLPRGWTAEDSMSLEPNKQAVQLVDPDSAAIIMLSIEPKKADLPTTFTGLRAEVENKYKQPQIPEQKLRPDSWQTRQVGGHPALSWLADSIDLLTRTKPLVLYTTWVRSPSTKAVFTALVDPADSESVRRSLDDIVNTFTLR